MIYKILLWANKERCDLDGYQQQIEVLLEEKHIYSWYSEKFENNPPEINIFFNIPVMKKEVSAASPHLAVVKFLRWYSNGLSESYLD
jgi:hypothetical protein